MKDGKHNGRVIIDVEGEEKSRLTIPDLLKMFEQASGDMLDSDSIKATIAAGANAVTWTPPTNGEVFKDIMDAYRKHQEHPTY